MLKVSVIISAYNAENYIEQTLLSVIAQTWMDLEIIVVNDGSTDNTETIISKFLDRGVKIINQKNKGQDAALNYGYKHSTGVYIKFMDSDDLINPEMIELQMKALVGTEDYVAYGEWARFYDGKPALADFTKLDYWKDMKPIDFLTARPEGVMLQCGIMLIPRKLIERAGLWDERLILFNDTEFYTRILLLSKGIKFTEKAKLFYRSGIFNSISLGRARRFYESTYLATNLIADHLLSQEDSVRIRRLISNTFLMQYHHMYPKYSDLLALHEEKIKHFGHADYSIEGGNLFNMLAKLFGWKKAKTIQIFFYDIGYLKLLHKSRYIKSKLRMW